ncbi:hypothetical protein ACWJKU_07645 [Methylocaldum sp. MU1018]
MQYEVGGFAAAQRLPFLRGLLGFLLFPQQFFAGFRHQGPGFGHGVVVVARIDGYQHFAGLEKAADGEGGMNADDLAGHLGNQIDLGARRDHTLRMDVQLHRLGLCQDYFDRGRLPFRDLRFDFGLAVDQRPGGYGARAQQKERQQDFQGERVDGHVGFSMKDRWKDQMVSEAMCRCELARDRGPKPAPTERGAA